MSRVRVGVVGLGGIAQTAHLPLLRRRWDLFEIAAIADLSAERRDRIGAAYGVPATARFSSLDDLCASGLVDAVVLLTAGNHAPEVLRVLDHGLPVLCEKPLGLTRAGAEAVVAAEAAAERPMVLVGYMKEYDAAVAGARDALARAGRPRVVDVEVLHPADGAQLAFANLLPPASDVEAATLADLTAAREADLDAAVGADTATELRTLYANVVLGSIVHDVSLLRNAVGPIEEVTGARHWTDEGMPGSLQLTGTLAGGVPFHLGWHFIPDYPAYRERLTVHHSTGSVEVRFAVPYVTDEPTDLEVVEAADAGERRSVTRCVADAFEAELVAFSRMVAGGTPPSSGPAEGLADLVVAQRIIAAIAAARGERVGGEAGE